MLRKVLFGAVALLLACSAAVSAAAWPEAGVQRSCAGNRGSSLGVTCVQLHPAGDGGAVVQVTRTANANWCSTARLAGSGARAEQATCGGRQEEVRWRPAVEVAGRVCAWWTATPDHRPCIEPARS
ncbi:hypothetical protein IQ251_12925 [Saccharopolyspora sp. HNM0983]|uniref:Secreted protein n=1 Tax=Saccharopolyspora montiporae TaxID=2781240 RepID=A0A929B8T3_9PSEU|nr:hypothetical protein [Saccharopolyspora sp. HNM0983]MBE9375349.1 hypothetical protein [Saccharopolyspora sp. HNM0983]